MRRCGRTFVEMEPDSAMATIVSEAGPVAINQKTYLGLVNLAREVQFSQEVCQLGHDRAILARLRPDQHESAKARFPIWRRIVDEIHRADIRQWACLQPYGYVLGMTLAEQYGFTSELLDFTSQPAVAIFFATHPNPYYLFTPLAGLVAKTKSDVGVVYRLPSSQGTIVHETIDSFDYYTCPPQVHMGDVCKRFEDESSPEMLAQLQGVMDEHTMAMMLNGATVWAHHRCF